MFSMQMRETAAAVSYLHDVHLVHGDIKAGNILISDDGHAMLTDFGLAKMASANTSTAMKGLGTARWQSPELWEGAPKTPESDIYAFAMLIVEVGRHLDLALECLNLCLTGPNWETSFSLARDRTRCDQGRPV